MQLNRKPCSDSPDHPATCRFPSPHPFHQGKKTESDSQAIKVLLVEHDSEYAEHIERVIGEEENSLIQLERTEWLDVASRRVRKGHVDAVLLDISLPDTSGVEIFRAIHHAGPGVPVLILTDLDDETMACQMLREGAQDYLPKHSLNARRISRSVRFAVERTKARKRPRSSRQVLATARPNRNWA
jgi:DNA-binding response OmpR family regulator